MASPIFDSKICFVNQLLLPRALYPEIKVPAGTPLYDAIPKTLTEMVRISQDRRDSYGFREDPGNRQMGSPRGYTRAGLSVCFENIDKQWRCQSGAWSFLGGRILLELTLAIYADKRAQHKPRCWALILEHELFHVHDEIDIVKNFLPKNLSVSPIIRGLLQLPIPDSEFEKTIRGSGAGRGSEFEQRIQTSVWINESSKRASLVHKQRHGDAKAIEDCITSP